MEKSIILAQIDDVCTEIYVDILQGVKTHKMALKLKNKVTPRPMHERIKHDHRKMYEEAVSDQSRVEFTLCDYLPDHQMYQSLMVVSKQFIKKKTRLHEVGGHHFPVDSDFITAGTLHCLLCVDIFKVLNYFYLSLLGVNDFSLIYSGKSQKKNVMHLLLGPISFVNHSCIPNTIFLAHQGGKIYLQTVKDIERGQEITVNYSSEYFGDDCLCEVCTTIYNRKCSGN